MYVRKTIDRWDVETDYGDGWCVECSEYSWKEARKTVQEYRDNPCGWLRIRLVKRREKKVACEGLPSHYWEPGWEDAEPDSSRNNYGDELPPF